MTTGRTWLQRVFGREDADAPDLLLAAAAEHEAGGKVLEARSALERVLAREPEHPQALLRLGHIAAAGRRLDAAADYFRRACRASPSDPEPHYGLGVTLLDAGSAREAEAAFRAGLLLQPHGVRMLNGLAAALIEIGRVDEAEVLLERAVHEDPQDAQTRMRMARALLDKGRLPEALTALQKAHELAPRDAVVHSALLFAANYSGESLPRELYEAHRRFGDLQAQPVAAPVVDRTEGRRLRVGYLSPDFRSHVVSAFMLPILARHDRARFEIFSYYLHTKSDAVTEGLRELSDHWRECGALPAREIAERIRADRIDILVDLAGHTMHNALPALALRPAPLQLTYLGYPNTTGLPAIDWRVTDDKADPSGEADALHTERLARLPRTFLCYRPGPGLEVGPLPARSNGFITFGCFNNILKLSGAFLRLMAALLAEVPGSRLLLKDRSFAFAERRDSLLRFFASAGIGASRIELRGWAPTPESHLTSYSGVDIALDSFPYNGTTTTCEALWMGVPVVSLRGERHAARVGASLLETVGLGELVAIGEQSYLRIAAGLARDLTRLEGLRAGMRARLRSSPLLDEAGFVRALEDCYERLWRDKRDDRSVETPAELEAFWNRALDERRFGEAIQRVGAAIEAAGESAQLRYMLGCALQEAGRLQEAAAAYRRALALQPQHAKALNNLGGVLETSGDPAGAVRCYDEALRAEPRLAIAFSNRGNLRKATDPAAAEADLRRAVELDPQRADWHAWLGECLAAQWKLDEALSAYQAALALAPQNARFHFCLANTLVRLGEVEAGEAALRHAIELDPNLEEAHGNLLFAIHYRHGDRPEELREAHERWGRSRPVPRVTGATPGRREGPLRIGYVSPDFRGHAVALFLAPLLASHDRSAFRIYGYSTASQSDEVTERLRQMCDEWREIASVPDDVAARGIRADGIDILVDLAGHTGGGRMGLFAHKPAPVQVAWLGYPGTSGLPAIDYRFTDAEADPPEADRHATEKLWRLPQGFLCFSAAADVPVAELPATQSGCITFGSFNNLAKVGPQVVAAWAEVLHAVPQGRLLLKAHALRSARARRRMIDAFAAQGVAESRLTLLPAEKRVEAHLARYGEVDIALDTFPYTGTTTTCEALWMGVPVVTLRGTSHVSRVGASLLARAGYPELIADSRTQYVAIAKAWASDLARLRETRRTLREQLLRSSVMDREGFARSVEAAYRAMVECREPLRLHIGGKETREGWKILNAQAGVGVHYVGTCSDLGQFADGSVEEIYASHVVEHLGYHSDLPRALREFHRVLKPGGVARISVPDFERLSRIFLAPTSTLDERYRSMRMVFGGQIDEHDFHRVGLSEEFLTQYLLHAGFRRVERVERFELFDDMSRLEMAGQQISLNVVAYK